MPKWGLVGRLEARNADRRGQPRGRVHLHVKGMRFRARCTRTDAPDQTTRRRRAPVVVLRVVCGTVAVALGGCGSSIAPQTTAVPGGAAVQAGASTPAYCRDLTSSEPLLQLSTSMSTLARDPGDTGAQEAMRSAATAVDGAARQAPAPQRVALLRAGSAIRALVARGLTGATGLDAALTHAGRSLQGTCSFPIG
jgi:hypothetical protein